MFYKTVTPITLPLGNQVYTVYYDKELTLPVAGFETRSSGMCCGERRIGNFWYMKYITNQSTGITVTTLSDEQLLEYLHYLLSNYCPDVPFVRGNLNSGYPVWDIALKKFGFRVIMEWQNRAGGSHMTEYAKVQKPLGKFKESK